MLALQPLQSVTSQGKPCDQSNDMTISDEWSQTCLYCRPDYWRSKQRRATPNTGSATLAVSH